MTTRSPELASEAVARAPLLLPPRNALIELALFVLVILALERYVPTFDLLRVEPNPCWLPVLLLSVQYGTVSGLLAAASCIALTIYTGFPEPEIGEDLFVYLLRAWAQPMLWLGAAVLLGQFRTRHIIERAELRQQVDTLSSQRAAIADHARNLRQRCDVLERHIAGRKGQEPVEALAVLARLAGDTSHDLADAFRACMAAVLPGAQVSLMRLGAAGLELVAANPEQGPRPVSGLEAAAPLVRELLSRKAPLSVLSAQGEQALAGYALVAVPIEAGDELVGAILVHDIDAQALDHDLPDALAVIGAAFSHRLGMLAGNADIVDLDGAIAGRQPLSAPLLKRLWRPWQRAEAAKAALGQAGRPQPAARRMLR